MITLLIISERRNAEVPAITALLPKGSWFHLVLDVIHSRYEIFLDVKESSFVITDLETRTKVRSHQLKALWLPRLESMHEEGFRNEDVLARFFASEYYAVIEGLVACVEAQSCLVVTHPNATFNAGNKVRQQRVAASLGMKLPPQIITNRKTFFMQQRWKRDAIFKPVASGSMHYDPLQEQAFIGKPVVITPELLQSIEREELQMTVHYFQKRLHFKTEYRVVVFGDQVFPFRITGDYDMDWRNHIPNIGITWQRDFPFRDACLAYTAHFGLALGCFDFIETADGIYFIECNPPGYFVFCDPQDEAGLLTAFAAYLNG